MAEQIPKNNKLKEKAWQIAKKTTEVVASPPNWMNRPLWVALLIATQGYAYPAKFLPIPDFRKKSKIEKVNYLS